MIHYREIDPSLFPLYDQVPMKTLVTSYYRIEKLNQGLDGILLTETPVEPYLKDFRVGAYSSVFRWQKWDLTNWGFFLAEDDDKPVGAVAVAAKTPGIHMLAGREDLAALWDIRVADGYKGQGIGHRLFNLAAMWARDRGLKQMKIECQNTNVPAVKFYHQQGATLGMIDEYAYYSEPDYRHETQLIWYLDL